MSDFFRSGTGYQPGPSGGDKPLPTLKISSVTPPSRVTPLKPSIIKARAEMDMLNADERWQIPEAFDAYGADAYLADITEHVMSNPEYEGYDEQEKRQIIDSFFKNRGKVMPQGMRRIDAGSAPRADVTVTQKKPVGPKDVIANAKAPDYVAQRYAKMTPDAMRTEYLNDVLKRRMGYSSEPMDEQLALFGKSQGMNEGKMNEALSRHYAGVQANNPYAPVPEDQLRGRDQGMANAQRLLNAGLISSDQMPMIANVTWSDDNAERLSKTPYTGFSDSRQRQMMEGVDAAYGAYESAKDIYGRASDYVRSMMFGERQGPMPKKGPFPWESDYVDTDMFERGMRSLPVPVRSGTTFAPSQNVNDYVPKQLPVGRRIKDNPRMNPNYGLLNFDVPKIPTESQMVRPEIGKLIAPFRPEFQK